MFELVEKIAKKEISKDIDKTTILQDYKIAVLSRNLSNIGKKEVLSGKAQFGIFGDGKEIAQIAYAKNFRDGDWRSGYYRDQTFMLAIGLLTPQEFFSQLYADTNEKNNPASKGRNMNNHYATENVHKDGSWKTLTEQKNSSGDIAPTSGQMPRLLGLAYASKLFRNNEELKDFTHLSHNGNEVAFGTIGDASTSEGQFFETLNAAGVMQVPMCIAIWDDGFGISVPRELQTVKGSISEALKGFVKEKETNGIHIFSCKGWDYPSLVEMFKKGVNLSRKEHTAVLFHVEEMVQPLGHSTSGSHERYKSKERLQWEKDHDPIKMMREWIIKNHIADAKELENIEKATLREALEAKNQAWTAYTSQFSNNKNELVKILHKYGDVSALLNNLNDYKRLLSKTVPTNKDIVQVAKKILTLVNKDTKYNFLRPILSKWIKSLEDNNRETFSSHLYAENNKSALKVKAVEPVYTEDSKKVNGNILLNRNFDAIFSQNPLVVTFGEDTGKLGDVNQGMKNMQEKYGEWRVSDTGIREASIIGQGIGLALRGLRPIAEIQYLDYLLYGLQTISDDLATTHFRTKGSQSAPMIIRTRGHRLEGIWHSGSPLSMIINSMRGVYVCVPRNMTQAAGFYNTLLSSNDPALIIEPLKAYMLKEKVPDNLGKYKIPIGVPDIVKSGCDITIVTYGWSVHIAMEAAEQLEEEGISVEVIDVQTLLPFDVHGAIKKSIKKTHKIVFLDEDVPGGATAYMMQQVLEDQKGFYHLDSPPRTITAQAHRPSYGGDGDYYSKPNVEMIFDLVYDIMGEYYPDKYPAR